MYYQNTEEGSGSMSEKIVISDILSVAKITAGKEHGRRDTAWIRKPVRHTVVAYKLSGVNVHTCEGREYPAEQDSVFVIGQDDTYSVKVTEFGPCIAAHFLSTDSLL